MKCDFEQIDENDKGWRKYRCRRADCGTIAGWTPHVPSPTKVQSVCNGWPHISEWGYWLAFVLEVFGLQKRRWTMLLYHANLLGPKGCSCDAREAWLNTVGGRTVMRWRAIRVWFSSRLWCGAASDRMAPAESQSSP